MNDKKMNIINIILYYVLAPILVLQFFLSDLGILQFTPLIFGGSLAVLVLLIVITQSYKKANPKYDFKPNEMYTRFLFLIVMFECLYSVGMFR